MEEELEDGGRISLSLTDAAGLLEGTELGYANAQPGAREVIYGDVRIEEEWNPERVIELKNIDLIWFVLRLRQQLRYMARLPQDEIEFSDPERRFHLLLWKEGGLLIVKNLLDKGQPSVRLDFKAFKRGFLDFQENLLADLIHRYPQIQDHPGYDEIVRMFR